MSFPLRLRIPLRVESRVRHPIGKSVHWHLAFCGDNFYAMCGLWSYGGRERSVRYLFGMN